VPVRVWSSESLLRASRKRRLHSATVLRSSTGKIGKDGYQTIVA
jgi:hypothetical protein